MIGIIGHFEVQDGKQAEFEAIANELMSKVKANEPGCLLYNFMKKKGSETEYAVMEQYVDQAAVDAHQQTDYFKDLGAKLAPCFAGRPVLNFLNEF